MIKKLKKKFLVTIMIIVTFALGMYVFATNYVPIRQEKQSAQVFLSQIADNGGVRLSLRELTNDEDAGNALYSYIENMTKNMANTISAYDAGETPPAFTAIPTQSAPLDGQLSIFSEYGTELFAMSNIIVAKLDENNNVVSWTGDRVDSYSDLYMDKSAEMIIKKGKNFGRLENQYYLLRSEENGKLLIMLDNSVAFYNRQYSMITSSIMTVLFWVLILCLSIILVNKMTEPVENSFKKQRQFIADASHELKTPIAVISANVNVLQPELGDNKWLSYIETETKQMEHLVHNMMTLAAIDVDAKKNEFRDFNLSDSVLEISLPFESLAFEQGIVMQFDVAPDIMLKGNEEEMKQLVGILLSNAIKYGEKDGTIKVSLTQVHKRITLSVYNTGIGIPPEDKDKIFDRFYRADKARDRQEGSYGLGLAIGQAIISEHNGKISVDSEYGEWTRFDVRLNAN